MRVVLDIFDLQQRQIANPLVEFDHDLAASVGVVMLFAMGCEIFDRLEDQIE
jgi:hypothetical protein